ncbi:MAG TPA: acyl-CoA dehydrogenase, partial [Ideonella sp.]|nr:acyl-CoA dehydrogenase [Ideonella sp.]
GDHDLTENIVQMTLARIDGAPAGIKGVSLFAVPSRRLGDDGVTLVDNDVRSAGMVHKIGWRGLPSMILNYGEAGDCHGWLVGEPHRGIQYMFQMMNEARIMVGMNGVATASAAYHESLAYARTRLQGRPVTARAAGPQIPIIEHADVRRMLLRQKAICEGSMALLLATARYADVAANGDESAQMLLDLLTPITKSFPAERGFESNALAVQIHGGYGYSSEYPVEAWLRDQKLNSLHEGTTGIQSLDLLGRKVGAEGGRAFGILLDELGAATGRARAAGAGVELCDRMTTAVGQLAAATQALGKLGLEGDVEGMLLHSADYLAMFSIVAIAWQWLLQAAVAAEAIRHDGIPRDFYAGKLAACRYWITTELPRVAVYAELCASGERSFADMRPEWF